MTYDLEFTSEAKQDIDRISAWYLSESKSIEVANRWYDGMLNALESLKEFPESFSLAGETDEFPYDLRQLLYGSGRHKTHRALFRIVENTVEVLSIRHLSQRDVAPDDVS